MATSIVPTAPTTTPSPVAPVTSAASGAPTTLADAAPSLAEQLYSTPPVTAPVAVAPTSDAVPDAAAPEAKPGETIPSPDEGPEYLQGEDGRWRRGDGTFASAEELAQIKQQLSEADKATQDAEANRPATVAKLRDREGNVIEVETGDEQLAQLINQNTNDGLRKREYVTAMAEVETLRSEFAEFQTMIATNPEAIILQMLPPEKQVTIAAQLLAQHFDSLVPIIQGYDQNPSSRLEAVTAAQLAIRNQEGEYTTRVASQRAATEVKQAVAALIPEQTDEATEKEFWLYASSALTRLVDEGQPVTKDTVAAQLASLAARFGFSGTPAAATAAPVRPRITLAKPSSAQPAAPAASLGTAKASQRVRLVTQRRNAAAIPPQGRGGLGKPADAPADRAFHDAANLLYGNTPRAS